LRSAHHLEKVVARFLAAPTDFGASATVLVMGRMKVAFLGTDGAGRRTRLDHCPHEAKIRRRLPRHDAAGGVAHVGAVEAEANDANHFVDIGFAQARVGAGGAAGGTVETLVDAAQESVAIKAAARLWVQLDDLLISHVSPLSGSSGGVPLFVPWLALTKDPSPTVRRTRAAGCAAASVAAVVLRVFAEAYADAFAFAREGSHL
jgi:hypothetical protein